MRRNPDVAPGVEQRFERTDERVAHLLEVLERNRRRLDVDAFAQPHAGTQVRERLDIGEGAPQHRLQHDADIVETVAAQLAVEPERLVGCRGVLHVDADEIATRRGVLDDGAEVVATDGVTELQSKPGQLHADVRVEVAALDVREHVLVRAHDRGCLFLVPDLLAENVDRRELPLRVEAPNRLARVFQLGTCDVARRELLHDRTRNGRKDADDRAVEDRHLAKIKEPTRRRRLKAARAPPAWPSQPPCMETQPLELARRGESNPIRA